MSPYDFEINVLKMFSKLGYSVKSTPFSNDRGKDG
ncbi:MAG: restriction endonuclease [Saccharofermentanales bacterium]